MLIPSLEYSPTFGADYEPDLFVLRSDLLLLAFYLILEDHDQVTIDEINTGAIFPEMITNVKKLTSFIMTYHQFDDDLEFALELPWDLVTLQKTWDSWEDHGFVVMDEPSGRVFITHAGMKRIQYLLESERFAPLLQATTAESAEIQRFERIVDEHPSEVSLSAFISFLVKPPSRVKHLFLIILGYLSFFASVVLVLSAGSLQNMFDAPADAVLISALAAATTLTFTLITYLLYRWIMMLRTRQPHIWNNLERAVSTEFLVFLNLVTLGAVTLYLFLHQFSRIISFPLLASALLLVTIALNGLLIIYQLREVKRSFIFQRMFYQQLHEIISESNRSHHEAEYVTSLFSEKSQATELLRQLESKISELSNRSLLGFIWQGSNYMVLYYVLMIVYITFEGFAMLLGKYMLPGIDNAMRKHSLVALVAGIFFVVGYFTMKYLMRHQWISRTGTGRFLLHSLKVDFYLRNILHDFLYAVNDPKGYQNLRKKASSVVTRFFEIFVFFSLFAILAYELTFTFVTKSNLLPIQLVDWLPFMFLIEGTLLVIIYALVGTISWITMVEIPLNDLDVSVNRLFKESSTSFVESLFQHYLLVPVLFQSIIRQHRSIF